MSAFGASGKVRGLGGYVFWVICLNNPEISIKNPWFSPSGFLGKSTNGVRCIEVACSRGMETIFSDNESMNIKKLRGTVFFCSKNIAVLWFPAAETSPTVCTWALRSLPGLCVLQQDLVPCFDEAESTGTLWISVCFFGRVYPGKVVVERKVVRFFNQRNENPPWK